MQDAQRVNFMTTSLTPYLYSLEEGENQYFIQNLVNYDMTVVDLFGSLKLPLLTLEMIHHFLKTMDQR